MTNNQEATSRTKHIALRFNHVRELLSREVISLEKVHTSVHIADVLTKPGTKSALDMFIRATGMSLLESLQ